MNNLPFLLVVLHKPTLWPSTFKNFEIGVYRFLHSNSSNIERSLMKRFTYELIIDLLYKLYLIQDQVFCSHQTLSCGGSVDKTTDSLLWGPQFESAGNGSSALGQGTLSSLPSLLERT